MNILNIIQKEVTIYPQNLNITLAGVYVPWNSGLVSRICECYGLFSSTRKIFLQSPLARMCDPNLCPYFKINHVEILKINSHKNDQINLSVWKTEEKEEIIVLRINKLFC